MSDHEAVAKFFASARLNNCPVCCAQADQAGWGTADGRQHVRSYTCGAVFERQGGFISVRDVCPGPSHVAVSGLLKEAAKAGA
nr:hypothetical protein [uncultured Shinella sp.]